MRITAAIAITIVFAVSACSNGPSTEQRETALADRLLKMNEGVDQVTTRIFLTEYVLCHTLKFFSERRLAEDFHADITAEFDSTMSTDTPLSNLRREKMEDDAKAFSFAIRNGTLDSEPLGWVK